MNEEDKRKLLEALNRVLNNKEEMHQATVYIHEAGKSNDLEFIHILKRIAAHFSKTDNHQLVFDSLHAQAMLGEHVKYYMQLAHRHEVDKQSAYYAILILARQPDNNILTELNQIREQSFDNHIKGAVDIARYVSYQNEQLDKIKDVESKFNFLVKNLEDGWNPIQIEEFSPRGNLSPIAVWSQRSLYKLSKEYPIEIAQNVYKIASSSDPKTLKQGFKDYVAMFIYEKATIELKRLEEWGR